MFEDFDWSLVGVGAIMLVLVALLGAAVYAGVQSDKQWNAFRNQHHCKVVAHIRGDVFNTFGVSAKGNAVVGVAATPDKTGWKCDDGVTYYR